MREMKARQRGGKRPGAGRPTKAAAAARAAADRESPPEADADDSLEPGFLHDQGDGVRVVSRARPGFDDAGSPECPDEAPPGWGDA